MGIGSKHMIKVTLYNETKKYKKQDAIDFLTEAMDSCDPMSSEYSRYSNCLSQILTGETEVSDKIY